MLCDGAGKEEAFLSDTDREDLIKDSRSIAEGEEGGAEVAGL